MVRPLNWVPSVYDDVPLPLGETMYIRLIRIRPSTTPDFRDDIVCDFSVLDVDSGTLLIEGNPLQQQQQPRKITNDCNTTSQAWERVQYQALSYTWGKSLTDFYVHDEPRRDLTIVLNGFIFTVRENLYDFLHMARKCKVEGFLWIDALCIDQATVAEKSQQVGMMGEVYSRAASVLVWLGKRTAAEEEDLNNALDIAEEATLSDEWLEPWGDVMWHFGLIDYWRRAWIVQEYYLARQKEIWYGHLRIDPKRLKHAVEWYNAKPLRLVLSINSSVDLVVRQARYQSTERFGTFRNLSKIFQYAHCCDPRDRVYAVLSLLSPEEREELGIYPDYSKSATLVFLQLVLRLRDGIDRPSHDSWHNMFYVLEAVMKPDLQDREVQLAILKIRTRGLVGETRFRFGRRGHICLKKKGLDAVINASGCTVCQKRPYVSLTTDSVGASDFSVRDAKAYVQALQDSKDQLDRKLGKEWMILFNESFSEK